MSKVNLSSIWFPPQFPEQGRLPNNEQQVWKNLLTQQKEEVNYHNERCATAGRRLTRACCRSLHISLFFDGTGNNLNHDLFESNPPHPTNISRMFRATIGDGYTAGVGPSRQMTDGSGTGNGDYYRYYIPGVGTPFPEIEDLDFNDLGMALGATGEARINWGLLMVINALRRALDMDPLSNTQMLAAVKSMATLYGVDKYLNKKSRMAAFREQLQPLEQKLRFALQPPNAGQCKLLGLKLFVYGFSRGAASARAFVTWLNELMHSQSFLKLDDLELPISVEYLGVLDTVASVGLADIIPGVSGHSAWADNTQPLPSSGLVKRCLHLVAGDEQRLCFPLDSIRLEDGTYPPNSAEVIYPGVHSDVGGGYPPGDQGKAIGRDDRFLLSQIALNDLYSDAYEHGAPLKAPKEALPDSLRNELWQAMGVELMREFTADSSLIRRFNAWRQSTLGLPPEREPLPNEAAETYTPQPATIPLERAMSNQLTWLTAWRIGRYASGSLKTTPFYQRATDTHAQTSMRTAAREARDRKQADIEKLRAEQDARESDPRYPKQPKPAGVKDFDPDIAQTQLREAAEEFRLAYDDPNPLSSALGRRILPKLSRTVLLFALPKNAQTEAVRMRTTGFEKYPELFPAPQRPKDSISAVQKGDVDESRNAVEPTGQLRALFDDQVHDSRAWFLYDYGREPRGSYFRERMVFFGDSRRKMLVQLVEHETELIALAEQEERSPFDPQRVAEAQKDIEAIWEDFYAKRKEAADEPV